MNNTTTIARPNEPVTLTIRLDARRAQLLWENASPAEYFEFENRFEDVEGDDGGISMYDSDAWSVGTVMWCGGVLEAMALCDYEAANGFESHLLWDKSSGPEWPNGYAVLTSRPWS
jgi:hypothetical protein